MRDIVSPLSGIQSPFGVRARAVLLSIYAVRGYEPALVLDFTGEYYFSGA